MAKLTLYVPQLKFATGDGDRGTPLVDPRQLPNVSLLLRRATQIELVSQSCEGNLYALCDRDADDVSPISIAALTGAIDIGAIAHDRLMRIDPVHCRVDPNQILLFRDPIIMPSVAEAQELIAALNANFPAHEIVCGTHPSRWYFAPKLDPATTTTPVSMVTGRSIASYMPRGPDAQPLAQLMNEMQMVLFDHPVNVRRQARGVAPINCVWPWGEATVDRIACAKPSLLAGDDVLLAGLARHLNLEWLADLAPPAAIARVQRSGGNALIVIGSPHGCIGESDLPIDINDLEQNWAPALLAGLRKFRLKQVVLVGDRYRFEISPFDMLKIWSRAPTSLSERA